jgi:hypothetical protein
MSKSRKALQAIAASLSAQLARGWAALRVARQIEAARRTEGARRDERIGRATSLCATIEEACVESAILALARLTVSHKDSISVAYLLNCMQHSPSAFPLPERAATLDAVAQHQEQLVGLQPLVERVKDHRDRTIAHLDKRYVNRRDTLHTYPPPALDEVEQAFVSIAAVLNACLRALGLPELELARLESDLGVEWVALLDIDEEVQS